MKTTKKQLEQLVEKLNEKFSNLELKVIANYPGYSLQNKNNPVATPYFSGTASECRGWIMGLQHGISYGQKNAATPELKNYTMEDWRKDRSFNAAIGQEVTQEVYDDLLNALPPTFWDCGYMQTGEAYSMMRVGDRYVDTYITFNGLEYVGHVPNMQRFGISGALEMAKNGTTPEFLK